MLYLKEGDLYKNVRMLTKEIKSPFYGDIYILVKGDVEDTWTLSSYDAENDKVDYGYNSSYTSNITSDDMLRIINDDTLLEYYKSSNSNHIKSKELDIEVGDLVEFGENPSYAFVTSIYKSVDDFIYVLSLSSNTTITRIAKKEAIKKVYKKMN